MATLTDTVLERRLALERAMMRVRWFGIALGLFQVLSYVPIPGTTKPASTNVVALSALALLLVVNIALVRLLRSSPSAATMGRVGVTVFALDMVAVWTIVWAYTFEAWGSTWVILTILTLEGALRFALKGALTPVAFALVIESVREAYRLTTVAELSEISGITLFLSDVTFRVGVMFMVGSVAGAIARNLERSRRSAEERAAIMEILAEQEHDARRESAAFQKVILAGVSEESVEEALGSMLDAIAVELGYERLAVLMRDEDRLHVVAMRGFGEHVSNESVPVGEGITGIVAETGRSRIVSDVRLEPNYRAVDERTLSQITLPIRIGPTVFGVLEVESSTTGAFDIIDLDRLERLSGQMALVVQNARLLATERATVERLQELDQMKSDFVAIASHELRTPLTSMQGSIKTMRRINNLDAGLQEELLSILDRQSDRLARLVEDLLLAGRIDAGQITLRMGATTMEEIMEDTLTEVGDQRDRISVAISDALPPMVTDGQRVGQIVRNLVENALKFSALDVPVRVTAHADPSGLVLEVADQGPGIPVEERSQIFERFHQVGGSMRRKSDGLGLGLFITARLVVALGGKIELDSTVDQGSTFRVTLPLAVASDVSETA